MDKMKNKTKVLRTPTRRRTTTTTIFKLVGPCEKLSRSKNWVHRHQKNSRIFFITEKSGFFAIFDLRKNSLILKISFFEKKILKVYWGHFEELAKETVIAFLK